MANYIKLALILLFSSLILFGCNSDDEESAARENNDGTTADEGNNENTDADSSDDANSNETDTDEQSNGNGDVLTDIHSFEHEDDIDIENILKKYDGCVVLFNAVDETGDDAVITTYLVYDRDVRDVSTIDNFSDCRFYSIDKTNTHYFTGVCYDVDDDRVPVVYDVKN